MTGSPDHRELRMTLVSDGARYNHPRVNADAKSDRLDQSMSQSAIQAFDSICDCGAGGDRLPAGDIGRPAHPEQGQQAVAQHLVGLAAGAQHRAAYGVQKLVDDEHSVVWQAPLGSRLDPRMSTNMMTT